MRSRRRQPALVVLGLVSAGLVGLAPAGQATAGPGPTPQTTVTAGYKDTCHDADGSPLDLRELAIADDTSKTPASYTLSLTTCSGWTTADLGNGVLEVPIAVDRTDGFDHVVEIRARSGALRLNVYRTPSSDRRTWTTTHDGVVVRPSSTVVSGSFPQQALDDPATAGAPTGFFFTAHAIDGEARQDLLPEAYADVLAYPFSCSLTVQQAATAVVEPGAGARVEGLAKARGATVRTLKPAAAANARSSRPAEPGVLALDDLADDALAAVRATPGVRSAQRAVVYRRMAVPDDPAYDQQWYLPAIGAPRAWDVRSGSGLTLAVLDDGVDGLRPDLAEKVVPGGLDTVWGGIAEDDRIELAADSDLGGHGTAVAGIAAAQTDNAFGVAAVDWGARVLPFRVFDAAGCSTDGAVVKALYAAADAGASVANLSLGGPGVSDALEQAVRDVTRRGMLVVAASGNSRETSDMPNYPAAYPEVLAVGATRRDGRVARYSSAGDYVDITAPGGDGDASVPENDMVVLGEQGTLTRRVGTSFAAPLVSAAALLYRAGKPELSPGQVIEAIERSAVDAGPAGRDPDYGAGRLDLRALLGTPPVSARSTSQACPEGYPRGSFTDVPPDSTHAANVDCIAWWQVSEGGSGGYDPLASVTRAQMATFLARLIERSGGTLPSDPPDAYRDDSTSVHQQRINQLANIGVVTGRTDGTFGPGEPVTRAQMAAFLVRAYEWRTSSTLPPAPDSFTDDDGSVHEPRINQAAAAGFTGGLSDGGYGPLREVRRDAMATFLARVLDRLVEDGVTRPPGA